MTNRKTGWAIARVATSIILAALFFWFIASWVNVVTHNTDPITAKELSTHGWNLFVRYFG